MLREVKKKAKSINKNLKILGVPVLTSVTNKSIKQLGFRNNIKKSCQYMQLRSLQFKYTNQSKSNCY